MKTDKNIVVKYRFGIHDWSANYIWPLDVAIALCTARDLSPDLDVARCAYINNGIAILESVEQWAYEA